MRTAFFDCFSGISGDMALGALLDCGVSAEDLRADLAQLNLPGWRLDAQEVSRSGIGAIDVTISQTEKQKHGRHLSDVEAILCAGNLSAQTQERALAVFRRLAAAEAKVHQTTPDRIHFHEVGAIDAIIDILGVCMALDRLGLEDIICAPLPMGHGFVECEHGIIPLPAPAVIELTTGFPVCSVDIEGELVTPTGAALMTTLARRFGPMPAMTIRTVGYGAGKKQFGDRPNLLRVIIGDTVEDVFSDAPEIAVLETNLDDFSPLFYDMLTDRLLGAGALDVYLSPIQMKKGRPATLLTVLTPPDKAEQLGEIVFTETTTLGVRFSTMRRLCLEREWVAVETKYGAIRVKVGRWSGVEKTASPEYEDVKAAALAHDMPIKTVYQAALSAYESDKRQDAD